MTLCSDVVVSINLAEFDFALMLMKLILAIEKAFDNERLTKSCCNWLWYCCLNPKINFNVDAVLQLKRPLSSFATGWKALHILFEMKQLAECRSRAAHKLVVLAKRKPKPADKLDCIAERESRVADKSGLADGSRATGVIELTDGSRATCKNQVFWELLVAAIGCSAMDSSSDFLPWHSPC
jgi:hypothetical protein